MKLFVTLPALALALTISSNALAENGAISSEKLHEMGLTGIQRMSDEAALDIRGMGYVSNHGHKSLSLAFGISYARVESGENHLGEADAGTLDGYLAVGKYMAMGEHLSEATIVKSKSHELWVKGKLAEKKVWTSSLTVGAGGKASASSL